MSDSALFTVEDLQRLPKPPIGVGSPVTLPSGSRGRVVAAAAPQGGKPRWVVLFPKGVVFVVRVDLLVS